MTANIGSQFKLLCCHLKPLQTRFRTGTQDTGQGPRSSLPATKPLTSLDPWIYSARESNTSSQTAPDWDQPGQGPKSRSLPATGPGQLREVSGRPRERRLLPANSKWLGRKPAQAVINGLAALFLTFPLILVCGQLREGQFQGDSGRGDCSRANSK